MTFLSPMWLWILAPWGALAVWLMWGRGRAAQVPFLDLWRGAESKPSVSRLFRPPPVAIVAALLGMLLGIVGAAGPVIGFGSSGEITLVLDRGITMSAAGRRAQVVEEAQRFLQRTFGRSRVELVMVPAAKAQATFPRDALEAEPTAMQTREMLRREVARALSRSDNVVVVLSDQQVQRHPRIVQIAPAGEVENVGIARFAIRERPTRQAMVTVRNDSRLASARLTVESVERAIDLPPRGQTRNYFIDLPRTSATPRAQIDVADDLEADNVAWLARQRDHPRIEIRPPVPAEVVRVVESYQKARPAGESGASVIVTSALDALKSDETAVIVSASRGGEEIVEAIDVRPHPITADIDWMQARIRSVDRAGDDPWTTLVWSQGKSLLSIRESPARRVRIDFDATEFARTSDFVVLWTRILDWVGDAGAETFAAAAVNDLTAAWQRREPENLAGEWIPGVYARQDGTVAAFNAPAVEFPSRTTRETADVIRESASGDGKAKLLPYLALAAVACFVIAAYTWPRHRLTPFFHARTV